MTYHRLNKDVYIICMYQIHKQQNIVKQKEYFTHQQPHSCIIQCKMNPKYKGDEVERLWDNWGIYKLVDS